MSLKYYALLSLRKKRRVSPIRASLRFVSPISVLGAAVARRYTTYITKNSNVYFILLNLIRIVYACMHKICRVYNQFSYRSYAKLLSNDLINKVYTSNKEITCTMCAWRVNYLYATRAATRRVVYAKYKHYTKSALHSWEFPTNSTRTCWTTAVRIIRKNLERY